MYQDGSSYSEKIPLPVGSHADFPHLVHVVKAKFFDLTEPGIPAMLIANKLDCEADRGVSRSQGKHFASRNDMK